MTIIIHSSLITQTLPFVLHSRSLDSDLLSKTNNLRRKIEHAEDANLIARLISLTQF